MRTGAEAKQKTDDEGPPEFLLLVASGCVMPEPEAIQESRMREIRTSGLRRAEVADPMACG